MKELAYTLPLYMIGLLGGLGIGVSTAMDWPWWVGALFGAASGIAHGVLIDAYRSAIRRRAHDVFLEDLRGRFEQAAIGPGEQRIVEEG